MNMIQDMGNEWVVYFVAALMAALIITTADDAIATYNTDRDIDNHQEQVLFDLMY